MMPEPGEKGARPKRDRIVINVDEQRKGARHRARNEGGGRRTLGIVLLLLVVILLSLLAGVYFWWQSYKTRPAYSLALMVDAVKRNDMAAFDEIVDTDKIVDNFVPQVTEKASARYGPALGQAARRQLEGLLPRVLPQVQQRVRDEVANEVKELSARAQNLPFPLIALGLPWAVDVNQQGETAKATVVLKDRPVELTMQRNGERWKVVGVKDDVLATRIVESIPQSLPSINTQSLPDLRRQLKKNLPEGAPKIPLLENDEK